MTLNEILSKAIDPALALLPFTMGADRARVMLLAIGLQESRFQHRKQINGPARGFWQFELGTEASRGGVWGVYLHQASRIHLRDLCARRSVDWNPAAIYKAIETDDVLAAGVARLMLWTSPSALPSPADIDAGWKLYLGVWRPGKPHPETWPAFYRQAGQEVAQVMA